MTRRDAVRLLGTAPLALPAQETTVFRVDVKLVRLLVTVKDAAGAPVGSLTREDFIVEDSGVAQDIALFERHTEQPLSVALLIDTSGSASKDLKFAVASTSRFLRALTREGNERDALALYSFNHDVTLHSSFTRNAARIDSALARLRADAGTSLYDAICFASDAVDDRDGRHILVIVSDGGDTTSARDYHAALRAAHRADAVIYALIIVPIPSDAGRNIGGEHALIGLSRSTGGRVFYPTPGASIDEAFNDILLDLRTQYLIGYYPKGLPPAERGFRQVTVRVSDPALRASTRSGYYES
jgi:Ca-activated chloride channel family protein